MSTCADCAFQSGGMCRRNPPQFRVYTDRNGEVCTDSTWPSVDRGHDWCGEFAPRLPVDEETDK